MGLVISAGGSYNTKMSSSGQDGEKGATGTHSGGDGHRKDKRGVPYKYNPVTRKLREIMGLDTDCVYPWVLPSREWGLLEHKERLMIWSLDHVHLGTWIICLRANVPPISSLGFERSVLKDKRMREIMEDQQLDFRGKWKALYNMGLAPMRRSRSFTELLEKLREEYKKVERFVVSPHMQPRFQERIGRVNRFKVEWQLQHASDSQILDILEENKEDLDAAKEQLLQLEQYLNAVKWAIADHGDKDFSNLDITHLQEGKSVTFNLDESSKKSVESQEDK